MNTSISTEHHVETIADFHLHQSPLQIHELGDSWENEWEENLTSVVADTV